MIYFIPTNSLKYTLAYNNRPCNRMVVRAMAADGERAIQIRDIIQANAGICPGRMLDLAEVRRVRPATP